MYGGERRGTRSHPHCDVSFDVRAMTPYYADPWLTVYEGDCRAVLASLPVESVHMVCTSPPYWGLRDYGSAGQLGLEPTPEQYVANMVAVFREVRRVLRADGTLWLNLGDSYASHDPGGYREGEFLNPGGRPPVKGQARNRAGNYRPSGLKPKDLVGIPWRVAFALQADGWYLRSDIIWAKPNPMPESVTDRPTKAHEYLFLLSKSARYYYDADAVREPITEATAERDRYSRVTVGKYEQVGPGDITADGVGRYTAGLVSHDQTRHPAGRNLRSVWRSPRSPTPAPTSRPSRRS
jgi:hypothetical protein